MEPIFRSLAKKICAEKVDEAILKNELVVAFDAGWTHRRNAHQCIGILLDVLTGYSLAYHIVYHSDEENETLTHTDKHAKAMEKIALKKILKSFDDEKIQKFTIVHDRDIVADNILHKIWQNCSVLFDRNHFTKSETRKIHSICSENKNLTSFCIYN